MNPPGRGPRRPSPSLTVVHDARRVLECSQTARQLQFQRLVRHYLSQLLHGCKSVYCDTPTCFSSIKRNASKPVRPHTQLTARVLAHYLASQSNPRAGLCPHELKVPPGHIAFDGVDGTGPRNGSKDYNRANEAYPSCSQLSSQQRLIHGIYDPTTPCEPHLAAAINARRQRKKDTKSLAQNLYDSVTMIYHLSRQIPMPSSVFAEVQSKANSTDNAASPQSANDAIAMVHAAVGEHLESAELKMRANERHVTAEPAVPGRLMRQHSQNRLRAQSQSRAVNASDRDTGPEQQIHRIPYRPTRRPTHNEKHKPRRLATMDGALDSTISRAKKDIEGMVMNPRNNSFPPIAARHSTNFPASYEASGVHSGTTEAGIPVISQLDCNKLEALKENVYSHRKYQSTDKDFEVDFDGRHPFRPTKQFVNRSLFYSLSDVVTLLNSFHDYTKAFEASPLPHLDSSRLAHSFRDWHRRNGALIFDSLSIAVDALFTPPPELRTPQAEPNSEPIPRYLECKEAAHIVMICIHALTSSAPIGWPHTWAQLRKFRSWGIIVPNVAPDTDAFAHPFMEIIDAFEYEPAMSLAEKLLCGIGTRTCFEHILASLLPAELEKHASRNSVPTLIDIVIQHLEHIEHVSLTSKQRLKVGQTRLEDPGWSVSSTFLEWARSIIIRKWDNKAEVNKWSDVGTAIMLFERMHTKREKLNLRANMFELPYLHDRLDAVDEPLEFMKWEERPNTFHILEFPHMFTPQQLVTYFRTINFSKMMEQYDHTTRTHHMRRSLDIFLREPHAWVVRYRMRVTLTELLTLDVSRADPLKDTLDQLWGAEKRMLLKPLKVKMGQQEGEVGQDHGGVTYEFFRVVLSQAFDPAHGMFTIDPQTRMTWFQPQALEPLWKFQMIGVILSLAIYNGVTLPVTFPLVFYQTLLRSVDTIDYRHHSLSMKPLDSIKDGWPGLHKAFADLLAWTDGDVGDVIMRDFAFSYQVFGERHDHNLKHPWSQNPGSFAQPEPELVTNANRLDFINDYIHCLTHTSVQPQVTAFRKGFLTCIEPRSLLFFTPSTLRDLIEGSQNISIADLKRVAKYEDGYTSTHTTICDFWQIVDTFDQDDCRRLLEFVTASDRIPVTGYESIVFNIVRTAGGDALPTSSTCFGKFYLPDYQDKQVMRTKLEVAIRNSRGFGVV
ncbi:hypothetical protein ACN47E_000038 [Coniothyrium glycines]